MKKEFDAIECTQNNQTFYMAFINKTVLSEVCFVSRRETNLEKGFQRTLNATRAKDIAKYFDEKNGVIPSSIILSAQKNSELTYNNGKISFEIKASTLMVLDGQHRLYGLLKTNDSFSMPVAIFNNLTIEKEVKLFIDINTNQKGVPSTLLLDIKELAGQQSTLEQRQKYLFDELNNNSVMAGKFSPASSKIGKITRVAFNKATKDFIQSRLFSEQSDSTLLNALRNFLEASEIILERANSPSAKLTSSMIFRSLLGVGTEIFEKSMDKYKNLKISSLTDIMEPLSTLSYDTYVGSSEATYSKIVSDMRNEIKKDLQIIDSSEIF